MSHPVGKNYGGAPEAGSHYQDKYAAYESRRPDIDAAEPPLPEGGDFEGDYLEEEGGMDSASFNPEMSADDLRGRIRMLRAALQDNAALSSSDKSKLLARLEALEGKVNYLVSLSPLERDAQIASVQQHLSEIETKCFGLEDGDLNGLLEMAEEAPAEGEEDEFSREALKKQAQGLEEKIESLLSKGMVTPEVYEQLKARFERMAAELDEKEPNLESLSSQFGEFGESLELLKSQYNINGEVIEEVPGMDGSTEGEEKPDILLKLAALLPGKPADAEKKVLEKLRQHYPELDADGDGKVEIKELKEAILNKTWPSLTGPDHKMLEFLYDLDVEFKAYFEAAPQDQWQSWKAASNRLVELLKAVFPGKSDQIKVGDWSGDARSWCNIWFDGKLYSFANKAVDGGGCINSQKEPNGLLWTQWYTDGSGWYPL